MSEAWTQAMVDSHNFRVSKENRIPVPADACSDESELHADILQECRRRGWLALHGSMAHKARRTAGEFDFVILADAPMKAARESNGFAPRVFFIEAKTRIGKLSPAQNALHAHARKLGHEVHVIRDLQSFLDLL